MTKKPKYSHQQMLYILHKICDVIAKYDAQLKSLYNEYVAAPAPDKNDIDNEITQAKREMVIFNDIKIAMMRKMIEPKQRYNFKLKPYQELSFHLELNGLLNVMDAQENMLQTICNNIHQKYAQLL